MDKFSRNTKSAKTKEKIESPNRPITGKETESVIKSTLTKKSPRLNDGFTGEFYRTLKELTPILFKLFQKKFNRREYFLSHSLKPVLPLHQNQAKTQGNYRPIIPYEH